MRLKDLTGLNGLKGRFPQLGKVWCASTSSRNNDAKVPIVIEGITDYKPPRAVTDCVTLIAMPRLSSGQMKQGFVLSLLKSLNAENVNRLAFVGSGSSAVVYDASRCDEAFLDGLLRLLTAPIVRTLQVHKPVVLKFTVITSIRSYEDAVRENTIHRYLCTASTNIKGHIISVKQQVPVFFWSGYLSGWYVTAMQYVRNKSLQQRLVTGPRVRRCAAHVLSYVVFRGSPRRRAFEEYRMLFAGGCVCLHHVGFWERIVPPAQLRLTAEQHLSPPFRRCDGLVCAAVSIRSKYRG